MGPSRRHGPLEANTQRVAAGMCHQHAVMIVPSGVQCSGDGPSASPLAVNQEGERAGHGPCSSLPRTMLLPPGTARTGRCRPGVVPVARAEGRVPYRPASDRFVTVQLPAETSPEGVVEWVTTVNDRVDDVHFAYGRCQVVPERGCQLRQGLDTGTEHLLNSEGGAELREELRRPQPEEPHPARVRRVSDPPRSLVVVGAAEDQVPFHLYLPSTNSLARDGSSGDAVPFAALMRRPPHRSSDVLSPTGRSLSGSSSVERGHLPGGTSLSDRAWW